MAANEKMIWDLLMVGVKNPYGAAAIMGNLMAESSLNPLNMTGRNAKQWVDKRVYFDAVNDGRYDAYTFEHDGIAVGLVQWLYWSRKQGLWEFAKKNGMDIGAADTQLAYMFVELPSYKTVWNAVTTATDINTPCDLFMLKYEKPGTTTEAAKQKRRDYAYRYFDTYADSVVVKEPVETVEPVVKEPDATTEPSAPISEPVGLQRERQLVTTASAVLVRCGNGKGYSPIGRIERMGSSYPWIASSADGWHAIQFGKQVGWVSGGFSKVVE